MRQSQNNYQTKTEWQLTMNLFSPLYEQFPIVRLYNMTFSFFCLVLQRQKNRNTTDKIAEIYEEDKRKTEKVGLLKLCRKRERERERERESERAQPDILGECRKKNKEKNRTKT